MSHTAPQSRLYEAVLSLSTMLALLLPGIAAASGNVTLEFRPHCDGDDELENVFGGPLPDVEGMTKLTEGTCYTYQVRDPMSLQTPVMRAGDILDMDIVINNPDKRPINRFRAWVAYDPTILEGIDVTVIPEFPVPTPGELQFTATEGTLKVSGSATTAINKERFGVVRVRFRILADTYEGTPLTFVEASGTTDAKTGVFEGVSPNEQNILVPVPGYLFVRLANTASSSSPIQPGGSSINAQNSNGSQGTGLSSVSQSATSLASFASSAISQASSAISKLFTMLQVLGLRVTTEGSSAFLAWDALPSAELAGYNIYYGTVSGRYIQRRTVDKSATSLTIRSLPLGTTYYFAVRAFNAQNEETVFSQEVAVSIGNPKTSTSPLNANTLPTATPGTGGAVSGETGTSSILLIAVLVCAGIGTFIAARRQLQLFRS